VFWGRQNQDNNLASTKHLKRIPMLWIHFRPDEAVTIQFKFCASFKFEVTSGFAPVDASGNPSHTFSFAVDKNSLKKFLLILSRYKKALLYL
jgi:hypothetical protein